MEEVNVTAIPIDLASTSVATKFPTTTTIPVTTEVSTTPATTTAHANDEAGKLIKTMQDMSIQTNEINRLKEQVKILESENKLVQMMHNAETKKSNRLNDRIQNLENELKLAEPLSQAKKKLWANIINSVNDIWPSIQVIMEQKDLIKEASGAIKKVKEELGKKLEETTEIIKFLNSKNKQELE